VPVITPLGGGGSIELLGPFTFHFDTPLFLTAGSPLYAAKAGQVLVNAFFVVTTSFDGGGGFQVIDDANANAAFSTSTVTAVTDGPFLETALATTAVRLVAANNLRALYTGVNPTAGVVDIYLLASV
jgi:hypothetical protein